MNLPAGRSGALTGAQRKWLRGQAHALKPVVQLGRQGLSESALRQIDAALDAHELIKVQAAVPRDEKSAMAESLSQRLGTEVAGVVGHVFILYREHPDPEKRRIEIPQRLS
jgi:RNA-binding protein